MAYLAHLLVDSKYPCQRMNPFSTQFVQSLDKVGYLLDPSPFKSLGSVASIGNTHAFGVVGSTEVTAYPASFIKKAFLYDSFLVFRFNDRNQNDLSPLLL
jgi:hypothetical protein